MNKADTMGAGRQTETLGLSSVREAQFGSSSRRFRLQTLVRLRWLAVAGQTLTVLIVALALSFRCRCCRPAS